MRIALCDFAVKNPADFVKQRAIDNNSPQRNQSEQAPSAGNKFFSAEASGLPQSEQAPSATRFSLGISIWITTGASKAPSASMHQDFPGAYTSGSQQKACLVKKWQC
jgi:hypothetical protein